MPTEAVATEVEKDITSQRMIKRGLIEDITDFLQTSNKLLNKKRRQINKSKLKASIEDTRSRKASISSLRCSDKRELPALILRIKKLESKIENIDITMIDVNVSHAACHPTGAQVLAISIKNIQYQAEKETRVKIDPKIVVPQEYHNFLDLFF